MKNRIGSKLLACLLVFVLIFTGAPFGAFATELDSDAVAEMEQISECGEDAPETSVADSIEPKSVQQSENEDPEDTVAPSAPSTDVPATAESVTETAEEPSTLEPTEDNDASSDVNSDVTDETAAAQSSDDMVDTDDPSAADIADIAENENSDDTNVTDAGDDKVSNSETTDTSADENGDAEADQAATGTVTDDVDTEENTESNETDEVVDETSDDNTEIEPTFFAEIRIVVNEGQPVYMGETVSLKVEVTDANYDYSIRWESHDPASDIEGEEPVWNTVGRDSEYAFLATQAALSLEYRVVVYAEQGEISKVVRITALERPEETSTETEPETDINTDLFEDSTDGEEPSIDDATDQNVTDQEDTSTDGYAGIDSDYEDNASDSVDPTEENKTNENAVSDDVLDNTDIENVPVDTNVDEEGAEKVDDDSSFDTDLPNDDAEHEEDTEDANESKVIDGNETNEEADADSDTDDEENTVGIENIENDKTIGNPEQDGHFDNAGDIKNPELIVFSEPVIITQTYTPGGKFDNDELLTGYAVKLFDSIGSSRKLRSAYSVGSSLTGSNAFIYSELKDMATDIANGNRTNSIYNHDYGTQGPWTAQDLAIESIVILDEATGNPVILQEAVDAALERVVPDISVVIDALLADCPYELYWYDKTVSTYTEYSYSYYGYSDGSDWYIVVEQFSFTCKMTVATEFQDNGNPYIVNVAATLSQEIQTAVANIQNIINSSSSMTPREKLNYFKTQICQMVSYNDEAADEDTNTNYGNPWQLVWVFDENNATNVVCEGYSKAFKYLCDQVGISCLLVTGMMDGGTGAGPHMWNLVKLDGYTYLVDVTNSDTGTAGSSGQLFMVMLEPGNEWDNYTISGVNYQYDDDTKAAYSLDTLSVSVNGAVIDENAPTFKGHSILLTGQIGLQFFLKLPDGKTASDYPGSYVTFAGNKINSETHRSLPTSTAMINGIDTGKYLFTVNLSSIQMADKIIPTFHYTEDGEDKTVVGDAYSAKDYISWALGIGVSSLTSQQKRIVSGLADYGHYAQPYLSRQNGWEIGADYAAMTSFQTKKYDYDGVMSATSNSAFSRTQETNDVMSVSYRLIFGSQISLQVRIAPANSDMVLPIDAPGGSISQSDGYYLVTYPGVFANLLTVTRTITAGDCTITVSPMSYVYDMLRSETEQDDAKNLVCALFGYAQACK